jgi:hypothetical protein
MQTIAQIARASHEFARRTKMRRDARDVPDWDWRSVPF